MNATPLEVTIMAMAAVALAFSLMALVTAIVRLRDRIKHGYPRQVRLLAWQWVVLFGAITPAAAALLQLGVALVFAPPAGAPADHWMEAQARTAAAVTGMPTLLAVLAVFCLMPVMFVAVTWWIDALDRHEIANQPTYTPENNPGRRRDDIPTPIQQGKRRNTD